MIHIVTAVSKTGCIGVNGTMPWHCPSELALFKTITMGHTVVMGRTTWLGMNRLLPGRTLLIATTQLDYQTGFAQVSCCTDLISLLQEYQKKEETLMVCGGASVYQIALPYADEISFSVMKQAYEGDTYFPTYSYDDFVCVQCTDYEQFTYYHLKKEGVLCDL